MSKVRPKRGPRLSPSNTTPPVVFEPSAGTEETSSTDSTSTTSSCSSGSTSPSSVSTNFSAYTETFSESESYFNPLTKMFKHLPYSSDSGFGIMNPMYDDGSGGTTDAADDPSVSKSTIATSQSLPTLTSTVKNLQTPPAKTTSVCSSTDSNSAKNLPKISSVVTPPKLPIPPVKSTPSDPSKDKESSTDMKNNNSPSPEPARLASSELVTPPNTPHSDLSSPTEKEPKIGTQFMNPLDIYNDESNLPNPAKELGGPLYNILGYPVDLPNAKSPTVKNNRISPEDTKSKMYPFSSYPTPSILDSFTDSEKVIEHLAKLGNGVYKDGGKPKNGIQKSAPEDQDARKKSDDWVNLEDKDQHIVRCWNHSADKPNKKSKKHSKDEEKGKSKGVQFNESKSVRVVRRDKSKLTKKETEEDESKRDSLFADLELPMIDEDVDNKKSFSSTATTSSNPSFSSEGNYQDTSGKCFVGLSP